MRGGSTDSRRRRVGKAEAGSVRKKGKKYGTAGTRRYLYWKLVGKIY